MKEIQEWLEELGYEYYLNNLDNIGILYLAGNNLKYIPDSIGMLKNLKYLDLGENNLESIPDSIGMLKNLEYLYLWNNNLKTLPSTIDELKNLKDLKIRYNPIKSFPLRLKPFLSKFCNRDWINKQNWINNSVEYIKTEVAGKDFFTVV